MSRIKDCFVLYLKGFTIINYSLLTYFYHVHKWQNKAAWIPCLIQNGLIKYRSIRYAFVKDKGLLGINRKDLLQLLLLWFLTNCSHVHKWHNEAAWLPCCLIPNGLIFASYVKTRFLAIIVRIFFAIAVAARTINKALSRIQACTIYTNEIGAPWEWRKSWPKLEKCN